MDYAGTKREMYLLTHFQILKGSQGEVDRFLIPVFQDEKFTTTNRINLSYIFAWIASFFVLISGTNI